MTIEIVISKAAKSEICGAIDGVVHNFGLLQSYANHNPHKSIKDTIERRSYQDKYYRRMLHNEFSARPVPAMVAIGTSVMAS